MRRDIKLRPPLLDRARTNVMKTRKSLLIMLCAVVWDLEFLRPTSAQDAVSTAEPVLVTGEEIVEKTELTNDPAAEPASVTVLR